jgi:hypothetical protein
MPEVELHADYDRDGRLSESAPEYAARRRWPGAVLVPNLDRDDRALPATVVSSPPVTLDLALSTRSAGDDELAPVVLRTGPETPEGEWRIHASGEIASYLVLLDEHRRPIDPAPAAQDAWAVTLGGGAPATSLFAEARSLLGSPLHVAPETERGTLVVTHETPEGVRTVVDAGVFTLSPFILLPNTAPVEALFVCELPDNAPAIADLEAALGGLTPLVRIPVAVHHGDTWIQDQLLLGYCQGPSGLMRVAVHLPRMRANSIETDAGENLAGFVTGHLPSRDLGLFDDFWGREVPVVDTDGHTHYLPFRQTHAILHLLYRTVRIRNRLIEQQDIVRRLLGDAGAPSAREPVAPDERRLHYDDRAVLPALWAELYRLVERLRGPELRPYHPGQRALVDELHTQIEQLHEALPIVGRGRVLLRAQGGEIRLERGAFDALARRLAEMHDGANFGGNFAASPPVEGAPLGKLVRGEEVETDLEEFLDVQWVQPTLVVETSWLAVGHVDELVAFVPDGVRPEPGGAVLHASTRLALDILTRAFELFFDGLPSVHELRARRRQRWAGWFSPILERLTSEGEAPLTHMLRGRHWLHHAEGPESHELLPPWIYRFMANINGSGLRTRFHRVGTTLGRHDLPLRVDPDGDHYYPARISVPEFLEFAAETNRELDRAFLAPLTNQLQNVFAGLPIIPVPVLFDRVPLPERGGASDAAELTPNELADIFRAHRTTGYLPNMINLQVAGNRLLVPRPEGPRMRPADAATVLGSVLDDWGIPAASDVFTEPWLRARGLLTLERWMKGPTRGAARGWTDLRWLAHEFRDGFPAPDLLPTRRCAEGEPPLECAIRRANLGVFVNGRLPNTWMKVVIPEQTVDLFEAFMWARVESLGLDLHFIDAWYYHLRYGGIHCGTKALRSPVEMARTPWWDAVPARVVEFEEEPV